MNVSLGNLLVATSLCSVTERNRALLRWCEGGGVLERRWFFRWLVETVEFLPIYVTFVWKADSQIFEMSVILGWLWICAESDLVYCWFSATHSFTSIIICIKGKISWGLNASLIGFWYHDDKSQRSVFRKSWEVIYQFPSLITLDSSVNEMF